MEDLTEQSYKEKYLALEQEFTSYKKAVQELVKILRINILREFTGDMTFELTEPLQSSKCICEEILNHVKQGTCSAPSCKHDLAIIVSQLEQINNTIAKMKAPYWGAKGKQE